ncbi:hypothetical protein ABE65_006445 [Fictibacillus phosphorivorans]|uniref:Uncharacterized protein n=1 Tax=Fictibacillus phosphorivorans TaxID=1221500 RepID=A0A160IKR4_9BACL|nr:hypothetical protein [Fictibacillus phosphorivorans]ANC76457.1 hypothetical protein ABE65_006445 [Fictibacillus phosphorivorans]
MALHDHPYINEAFVLNKTEVIKAVEAYLLREGYETGDSMKADGVDLMAKNEYHTLLIAAQGNLSELTAYQKQDDFSMQLVNLLKSHEKNPAKTLVLAHPDTPSYREKANTIKHALDDLGMVRFWVKEDGTIEWE